jgi:hypothetical protein
MALRYAQGAVTKGQNGLGFGNARQCCPEAAMSAFDPLRTLTRSVKFGPSQLHQIAGHYVSS